MSGHDPHLGQSGTADPSMEDILASIRRILSEDDTAPPDGVTAAPLGPDESEVLQLSESMLVTPTAHASPDHADMPHAEPAFPPPPPVSLPHDPPPVSPAPFVDAPAVAMAERLAEDAPVTVSMSPFPADPASAPSLPPGAPLVAPAAAAAAAASVGALVRHLSHERQMAVYQGGPTIEDLVRAELRPLLKDWLDNHLPPLVERLVRVEIERVVGRAVP